MKPPRSRRLAYILIAWGLGVGVGSAVVSASVTRWMMCGQKAEVLKRLDEIKKAIADLKVSPEMQAVLKKRITELEASK